MSDVLLLLFFLPKKIIIIRGRRGVYLLYLDGHTNYIICVINCIFWHAEMVVFVRTRGIFFFFFSQYTIFVISRT